MTPNMHINALREQVLALEAEVERLLGACKDKTALLKGAYAEVERLKALRFFYVAQLQPDDDSPGLWIGFKTADQRAAAMKMFRLEEPKL